MARNGIIVEPSGRTVFYAGQAPKPLDTVVLKGKPAPQHPASSPAVVSAGGDVATRPATSSHSAGSAKSAARVWTVQVASFETLDEAQTLELSLCQRGYDARIVGSNRPPFTVQVGAYPSSDSAMIVARHLSSRELTVFVTQAER
jgi:cell division protein FtsN